MPRFVVLHHELPPGAARSSHWDLMFEVAGALRTWAIETPPKEWQAGEALALPEHRLAYLDYEGPVSGDRGAVTRYDAGDYCVVREAPGHWTLDLAGKRLRGRLSLERIDLGAEGDAAASIWRFGFVAGS
jgi:hypothetical protein